MAQVTADTILHLQNFGLERLDEDRAIVGFAQKTEAKLGPAVEFFGIDQLVLQAAPQALDESKMFFRGVVVWPKYSCGAAIVRE